MAIWQCDGCEMLQKYRYKWKKVRTKIQKTKASPMTCPMCVRLAPGVSVCRCVGVSVSVSMSSSASSSVSPPLKSLRDVFVDHTELVIFGH
jgi:hypothetical protein